MERLSWTGTISPHFPRTPAAQLGGGKSKRRPRLRQGHIMPNHNPARASRQALPAAPATELLQGVGLRKNKKGQALATADICVCVHSRSE